MYAFIYVCLYRCESFYILFIKLKKSFFNKEKNLFHFKARNAGAVIHSHSKSAALVTLLYDEEFKISHQEMIKGIWNDKLKRNHLYTEELIVPIIENTCWEEDLKDSLAEAIEKYPHTCAVLVRRHGVYVWGETWEKAKTM